MRAVLALTTLAAASAIQLRSGGLRQQSLASGKAADLRLAPVAAGEAMSRAYPVAAAGKTAAKQLEIKEWADGFSSEYLKPLLDYFPSACDCNFKLLSANMAFKGANLKSVFKVAPVVGPSVVREKVTVSAALVVASMEAVEKGPKRYPSDVLVGRNKNWGKTSTSSNYPFAVGDAISAIDDWLQYANDPERIECRQFYASDGFATIFVPRRPELGLHKSLLFYVNTDALQYPRAPAHALTTAAEIQTHFKAMATKASREIVAYNARDASKKRKGGKVDAFAQQRAAITNRKPLPLVRNPESLVSSANLVTEGALTAAVLAIAAGLEAPLAWLLPESSERDVFCPGANWDQGLYATAAYFYCSVYALVLGLAGVPPARGARAEGLRTLADELDIDRTALAARLRARLDGGAPSQADVDGLMQCLGVCLSLPDELSTFAATAQTSRLVALAFFEGAVELRRRAEKHMPKINAEWLAVGFPGIGAAPPSWADQDDAIRAGMNAATGVPLFDVKWARAAAPAPAPAPSSKKRKGKGAGGAGKKAKKAPPKKKSAGGFDLGTM